MAEVRIGQMIVDDYGISKVIRMDDLGYMSEVIIPKDIFIEAYKKWIEKESEDSSNDV